MKKAFITIDVGLIILTIIPVIVVLADCIDSAVNGVIPWREDSTFIYGMPAFFNTLGVYFVFGFVLVVLWAILLLVTAGFTVFTVIYAKKKKRNHRIVTPSPATIPKGEDR